MRFVVVLAVLAVAVVILNRLNNRRAADKATKLSARFADKGWKAEAVGDQVDRTDLRVEGTSAHGHRFVAVAFHTGQELAHVEATVTFPEIAARVALPTVQRHTGTVVVGGKGDADRAVLETAFGDAALNHLDQVRGVVLESTAPGGGPLVFQTSRLAVGGDHLVDTVACLDRIVVSLGQAGYVKTEPS